MKNLLIQLLYNIYIERINSTIDTLKHTKHSMKTQVRRSNVMYTNNNIGNIHTLYKHSTNNIMSYYYHDNIATNIINIILNTTIDNTPINILHTKPIYIHTIETVHILIFIYIPKALYGQNNLYIERILNSTTILEGVLTNKLYSKSVHINYIVLRYNYIDSTILSNTISNIIGKHNVYKGKYSSIQDNNILLTNSTQVLVNRYNTIENLQTYMYKMYIYNQQLNYNINHINIQEVLPNIMINQYLIGYKLVYKGKRALTDSNARAIKYIKHKGAFNTYNIYNISNSNTYTLNTYKHSITKSHTFNTNKNGLYNTNILLSHI